MLKKENIIYEDNHLLVVNKPAGLLVQADKTGDETLADWAKQYLKIKYNKPGDVFLGVVHRLDRPVSGAIVLARTSKGLERMNNLFKERKIDKTYWAITSHRPPNTEAELTHWLKKNTKINKTSAFNKMSHGAQKAELSYKLIARIGEFYMLEVKLMTGRPHQIRAQLAKIGCPVYGDVKYGADKPSKDGRIYLHSRFLSFDHPIKKDQISITAPLPNDQIWKLF